MKLALNVFVFFIPFICAEIIDPQIVIYEEKLKQELTVPKTTFSPDSTNFETSSNPDSENLNEFYNLLKNIKINVVAPASDISEEKMEELKNITLLNLNIPKFCFSGNDSELPKTSDEIRFYCLAKAIVDDKSNIIWTLRGGYGSAKIIPYLSKLPKPKIEKYFIGFTRLNQNKEER